MFKTLLMFCCCSFSIPVLFFSRRAKETLQETNILMSTETNSILTSQLLEVFLRKTVLCNKNKMKNENKSETKHFTSTSNAYLRDTKLTTLQ